MDAWNPQRKIDMPEARSIITDRTKEKHETTDCGFQDLVESRCKSSKITITNDKGRLSKEEIERMVSEAEKYKAEDEAAAERITAKNGLESYAYNLRNSVDGDLKDKLEGSDKETLEKAISETISWLDASAEASKEEYEEKQKELEGIANPIMQKVYAAAGGAPGGMPSGGMPGAPPNAGGDEPSVEEVD
ncbi:uncharacterized protein JCM6883_004565 [Sporobolomyces salmoneus]|uniref:uncharacterized protein n=1 Tax=Sporobolomyces salmoneus TaxID=183962 RepID=UPI0031828EC6